MAEDTATLAPPAQPKPMKAADPRAIQRQLDPLAAQFQEIVRCQGTPIVGESAPVKAARLAKLDQELAGCREKLEALRQQAPALVGVRVHYHESQGSGGCWPAILMALGMDGRWDLVVCVRGIWQQRYRKLHTDNATPNAWSFMPNGLM